MTNTTLTAIPVGEVDGPVIRLVRLMPAPATVVALAVAHAHALGSPALAVLAGIGAVATVTSALLPVLWTATRSADRTDGAMPAPSERDRIVNR